MECRHIFEAMIKAWIKIKRLLFFLFLFPGSFVGTLLLRSRSFLAWSLGWWWWAFRILPIDLFHSFLVPSIHKRFYLLVSLSLSNRCFEVIVSGLSFPFKLLECTFSLGIRFTSLARTARVMATFPRLSLPIHYFQVHCGCGAPLTRCRCCDLINLVAKLMNGERVVTRVLVLPGERIFAFLLLPENLEHSAVVHDVEAIVNWLNSNALAVHLHLVDEGVRFSAHTDIFGLEKEEEDSVYLVTYCFISALSWPLSIIFFLLLIFELKSSTVTSRSSIWNLQMNCFLVLRKRETRNV